MDNQSRVPADLAAGIDKQAEERQAVLDATPRQRTVPTCKICNHPDRRAMEATFMAGVAERHSVRRMVQTIQEIDPGINATNVRGHFGYNKDSSGFLKPAHTVVGDKVTSMGGAIKRTTESLIREAAKEVAIADLRKKQRVVSMQWLENTDGATLPPQVGARLLMSSIDQDFKEREIEIKRSASDKMGMLLVAGVNLMGAILGSKKRQDYLEQTVGTIQGEITQVEQPQPLPSPADGLPT